MFKVVNICLSLPEGLTKVCHINKKTLSRVGALVKNQWWFERTLRGDNFILNNSPKLEYLDYLSEIEIAVTRLMFVNCLQLQ